MSSFEVPEPIQNSPFAEPERHWFIREGEAPELRDGRRPSIVFPPRDERHDRHVEWTVTDGTLERSQRYAPAYEMALVNRIRAQVAKWREAGYPGVTGTTLDLLRYWRRDGRKNRLFFAHLDAAETIIFLREARADFLQGIDVPRDEPSDEKKAEGVAGFLRYACKMATGTGKTTVMGMLAAWSILNKVHNRTDARFSDVVLAVCPNVTIRSRLGELDPERDDASVYIVRQLVDPHWMKDLRQGRVLVTNWHVFELQAPQTGGETARVVRTGQEVIVEEWVQIGTRTTTARGSRYFTPEALDAAIVQGKAHVLEEVRNPDGTLKKVRLRSVRYVESDTAFVRRVLDRDAPGKQNVLVFNDEAHHAYRIRRPESEEDEDDWDEEEDIEYTEQEATVWIDGLDRVNKLRGINFCVDLSATPYFLSRVGQETNRPFPWVVSDFGLIDAIESGLTKIPQLAVRDTSGAEVPYYFNVWKWILETKLTPAERGGKKANPKPEAILKYAQTPIAILGGLWEETWQEWKADGIERPPVFIIVCKTTQLAKVVFEWLATGDAPAGIPPTKLHAFRNRDGALNTIRVDSKVVHETDTGESKSAESAWMRFTLDTVGKRDWPKDRQRRPVYPEGFEELAKKLERPLDPPGRDVRCIVSVGMLTEGWDCNTVTHIIGLRPFQSQLLCEQVVGRGLRRTSYDEDENDRFPEEVAKVFGVPFEIIPFKANPQGPAPPQPPRHFVHAIPEKAQYEIRFPRVEGYTQAIRNRVAVDWNTVSTLVLNPLEIPPEVEMKANIPNNEGRPSLTGPGRLINVTLNPYRKGRRLQELVFDLAADLTRDYARQPSCTVPAHALFPQMRGIVERYLREKVRPVAPAELVDVFLSPYYGWAVERLVEAIRPDTSQGEAPEVPKYESHREPGTTADVALWTKREVRPLVKSHLNYMIADTQQLEQVTATRLDQHPIVEAFVKNAGLEFAIPYFHNGQSHEYIPDFIVRLNATPPRHLIVETKGYDPLEEVKRQAAERWCAAVSADGTYGRWDYRIVRKAEDVERVLSEFA